MARHTSSDLQIQERYDVLLDIGRVLTATLAPEALYRAIYEQASRVLETTGFFISLYEEPKDQATVVFYADRGQIERPDVTYRGSESRAIREARPIAEEVEHPDRALLLLGPESDEDVTRSVIAAPMLRDERVLGVISAQSYASEAYTDADLELLTGIAGIAAVAIANARAVTEIERQRRESERLESISRALSASLDLDEVLQRIVAATRDLAEADGAGVWFLQDDGQAELVMTAGEVALPVGTSAEVPAGLIERMQGGEPLVIRRAERPSGVPEALLNALQAASAVAVPMVAEREIIGALSISHLEDRTYAPAEIGLLERFAFNAAVAVANARLHEQLRTLSLTDPLTSLPNRRHLEMFLRKEFAAAERGRNLTVILYDLDDFKIYNDTEGHQAGDAILGRFGEILESQTRAMNLAARYGGDEFLSILSDTDLDGGAIHRERVFAQVQSDPGMGGVGVSAGMATYQQDMKGPEDLIRAADEALYRAKAERESGSADQ